MHPDCIGFIPTPLSHYLDTCYTGWITHVLFAGLLFDDIDILSKSETWLINHIPDQQFAIPGYAMVRLDIQRSGQWTKIVLSMVVVHIIICSLRTNSISLYVLT